jgi:hypothetical protein
MDTTRWECENGDFTISDSAGRLLIAIEPADAPHGDYYAVWEDVWTPEQLILRQPLDWEDEDENAGHIERDFEDGSVKVVVLPEPGQREALGDYTPTVTLTPVQWEQAMNVLLPPPG